MAPDNSKHKHAAAQLRYYVVICTQTYQAPIGGNQPTIFKRGEVYQAEMHGNEYRVWRSKRSFLKFTQSRFVQYFKIFC